MEQLKYFLDARCDNKRPQAGVGHVRGRHQARQGLSAPGRRALQQVGTGFKELWKSKQIGCLRKGENLTLMPDDVYILPP